LFTQCPKCETTYRVSSDDLSDAHGEVECGNCSQRFDALARLSESLPMPVFAPPTRESDYPATAGSEEESQQDQAFQEQDQEQLPDEQVEEVGDADAEGMNEERAEHEGDEHGDEDQTNRDEHESDERGDEDHTNRAEHDGDEHGAEDHTDRTEHEIGDEDQLEHEGDAHEDGRTDDLADDDWDDNVTDQSGADENANDLYDHADSGIHGAEEFEDQRDPTIDKHPDAGEHIGEPLNEDPGNGDAVDNEGETEADQMTDIDPSETVDLGEYDWQHTTVVQPQKPPPMEVRFEDDPEAGLDVEVPADPDAAVVDDDALVPSELTPAASVTSKSWLRWAVIGVLLVCLFAWIHQTRGMLARNALLRPALSVFYAAIGIDLQPTWDISGFAILSSTASEERGGRLVVTATYTNIAEFPQPYPTLRVILEDRWGEPLDVRYFEPREYLAGFVAGRPMGAGESATGEASIPTTGPSAVGFSVDVCLTAAEGDIRCASDL